MNGMEFSTVVQAEFAVDRLVKKWIKSYLYSLKSCKGESGRNGDESTIVEVTFSKPQPQSPVPLAVVHVEFKVDDQSNVLSYCIEGERHVFQLQDRIAIDELHLDRIIHRKLALKGIIDLQDDFISTRLPSCSTFVKPHNKESSFSSVTTTSDCSVNDLTRYNLPRKTNSFDQIKEDLLNQFVQHDPEKTGKLNFQTFAKVVHNAKLDISQEEKETLFVHAYEDDQGQIHYREFLHHVFDLIQIYLKPPTSVSSTKMINTTNLIKITPLPNKTTTTTTTHQQQQEETKKTNSVSLSFLESKQPTDHSPVLSTTIEMITEEMEIMKARDKIACKEMKQCFQFMEEQLWKKTREPNRKLFRQVLHSPLLELNKEEINFTLALIKDPITPLQCQELLIKSRILIGKTQSKLHTEILIPHLIEIFSIPEDAKNTQLTRKDILQALASSSILMLSKMQIFDIVAQLELDPHGYMDPCSAIQTVHQVIQNMVLSQHFLLKAKHLENIQQQCLQLLKSPKDIENKLLQQFSEFDIHQNGLLNVQEFTLCLRAGLHQLELTHQDIQWFIAVADHQHTGVIPYEPFLASIYSHLTHIFTNKIFQSIILQNQQQISKTV